MSARDVAIGSALAVLFALAATAAGAIAPRRSPPPRPPLILVSFDGFRWDYLDRGLTPNLSRLAEAGVRARALVPSFPTKTFPNHYTLVTGLLPEHHGIVDNTVKDPVTGALFHAGDSLAARDARWWGGEPIWVTAERQGTRAAAMFWPGSEAPIAGFRPTYWRRYDARVPDSARVDQVLAWLDLPDAQRPAVLLLYLSDTDDVGHRYGPDGPQMADAIRQVDAMVGRLVEGLRARGLEGRANLVFVSDHGMEAIDTTRVVVLDDYLDPRAVELLTAGPLLAFNPRPGLQDSVERAAARIPHAHIYRRQETPERWRYRDNPRIAAFVGVADAGWQVLERLPLRIRPQLFTGGSHGYDPTDAAMAGILVAAGPAFRRGVVLDPLGNVNVYGLLCRAAGLASAPNDGSPDSVAAFFAGDSPPAR
jgi:predicted AlkP superfamily pyrophosphatase or phosphodiesterase